MPYLDTVVAQAEGLGLGDLFADHRAYQQRAAQLNNQLGAARADAERQRGRLVDALVAGKQVDLQTLTASAATSTAWQFDGPAAMLVVAAVKSAYQRANGAALEAMPALFTALVEAADNAVTESVELAGTLPAGVADEKAAYRAGREHFETWLRLEELAARYAAIHDTAGTMRQGGFVPDMRWAGTSVYDKRDQLVALRRPERLPAGYWSSPLPLRLAIAHNAHAGPGLYDADDAHQRWQASQPRDYTEPMERIDRFDHNGALVG
jgi:hypothetical protein